jgi:hypothetical protein
VNGNGLLENGFRKAPGEEEDDVQPDEAVVDERGLLARGFISDGDAGSREGRESHHQDEVTDRITNNASRITHHALRERPENSLRGKSADAGPVMLDA